MLQIKFVNITKVRTLFHVMQETLKTTSLKIGDVQFEFCVGKESSVLDKINITLS